MALNCRGRQLSSRITVSHESQSLISVISPTIMGTPTLHSHNLQVFGSPQNSNHFFVVPMDFLKSYSVISIHISSYIHPSIICLTNKPWWKHNRIDGCNNRSMTAMTQGLPAEDSIIISLINVADCWDKSAQCNKPINKKGKQSKQFVWTFLKSATLRQHPAHNDLSSKQNFFSPVKSRPVKQRKHVCHHLWNLAGRKYICPFSCSIHL